MSQIRCEWASLVLPLWYFRFKCVVCGDLDLGLTEITCSLYTELGRHWDWTEAQQAATASWLSPEPEPGCLPELSTGARVSSLPPPGICHPRCQQPDDISRHFMNVFSLKYFSPTKSRILAAVESADAQSLFQLNTKKFYLSWKQDEIVKKLKHWISIIKLSQEFGIRIVFHISTSTRPAWIIFVVASYRTVNHCF